MPDRTASPMPRRFFRFAAMTTAAALAGAGLAAAVVQEGGAPPAEVLEKGKAVYTEQCESCHGPEGKGDGPAARFLDPKPRDYTSGEWKFATDGTVENVARVVREGIDDTGMTPFDEILDADQTTAVANYVVYVLAKGGGSGH